MGRSILAIVVGYAIFGAAAFALFAIARQPPHAPALPSVIIGSTVYGVAFSLIAGSVAAQLAPSRHVFHAGVVAVIIALAATAALVTRPEDGSVWSQTTTLFLMAPAALVGGWLRNR